MASKKKLNYYQITFRYIIDGLGMSRFSGTVYIPQKGYVFSEAWCTCTYLENIFSPKIYSRILENTLIFVPGTFFDIYLF